LRVASSAPEQRVKRHGGEPGPNLRGSSVWGISQTLEDFVGTETQQRLPWVRHHQECLNQDHRAATGRRRASGDSPGAESGGSERDQAPERARKGRSADVLLVIGEKAETTQTIRLVPTPVEYWVCTTFPRERSYRTYCLERDTSRPALEVYEELARRFPNGLAEVPPLAEEVSGAVMGVDAR